MPEEYPDDVAEEELTENLDEYMNDPHQRMYENGDDMQNAASMPNDDEEAWQILQESDTEELVLEGQKITRLKRFAHRPEWLWLESQGLGNLPTHVSGCSIGVHETRCQWQGYYGGHSRGMTCQWSSKVTPKKALLTAVVGVLREHVSNSNDKMWRRHLACAEEQLSKIS